MKVNQCVEKKTRDIALCLSCSLILLLISSIQSFAVSQKNGWIYQSSYPTSQILLGVKFISPQKGWIVGSGGMILYTEDDGKNWEAQDSGTYEMLKGISFVDDKTGWVVGNNGVILHTGNGGKTWERQGDTILSLHKVFFLNRHEGWAVGERGIILHTVDGGRRWEKQILGTDQNIAKLFFINSNTGWLLSAGKVYKTDTGGKDWEGVSLPIKTMLSREGVLDNWQGDVFFVDEKRGWVVIGLREIFHTTDGGKIWVHQYSGHEINEFTRLFFMDKKRGCAAGDIMVCTENGGETWEMRQDVMPYHISLGEHGEDRIGVAGLDFVDKNVGWAVGANGWMMRTEDGGKSWLPKNKEFNYSTYFINEKTGWTLKFNAILKTDDGGDTWKVQKEFKEQATDTVMYTYGPGDHRYVKEKFDVDTSFNSIFFINPDEGWFIGHQRYYKPGGYNIELNSFILHTLDGGKTWSTKLKRPGRKSWDFWGELGELRDVFFVNPDLGWVVGTNGLILRTKDGGKNWEKQKSGTKFHLTGVHFIDEQNGWIIGYRKAKNWDTEGVVLATKDGGKHWNIKWKRKDIEPHNIFMIDKKRGWITGMNITEDDGPGQTYTPNLFLQTEDGGKTWQDTGSEGVSYSAPFFIDKRRGWIETGERQILITEDSGKTWKKIKTGLHKYPWRPFEP